MSTPPFAPLFSYYAGPITDLTPTGAPLALPDLWGQLREPSAAVRELLAQLRAVPPADKARRDQLKTRLPYVTPAGVFTARRERHLRNRSGLLPLDFDNVPDVGAARAALLADAVLGPALALAFVSPSGAGLKAFIGYEVTPYGATHREMFNAVGAYIGRHLPGLTLDRSGSDVCRACYLSYDPAPYLNPYFLAGRV